MLKEISNQNSTADNKEFTLESFPSADEEYSGFPIAVYSLKQGSYIGFISNITYNKEEETIAITVAINGEGKISKTYPVVYQDNFDTLSIDTPLYSFLKDMDAINSDGFIIWEALSYCIVDVEIEYDEDDACIKTIKPHIMKEIPFKAYVSKNLR